MTDKNESMSGQDFSSLLGELEAAFNYILSDRSSLAYWKWLKDIPRQRLEMEIKNIILTEHKFPTIARLSLARPASKPPCRVCKSTTYSAIMGDTCLDCRRKVSA